MEEEIEMVKNVTLELLNKHSTASINVEFIEDPQWTGFKFITERTGTYRPTIAECEK